MPQPICRNSNYTLTDTSKIQLDSKAYDGNAGAYDWILEAGNVTTSNGGLSMLLTETNGGTRISSTRYIHYGTITATLKTGRWAGVVTAFITMSSIKDEIDWEFPGTQTTQGQTNYFWQGVIAPTHGSIVKDINPNTYDSYHAFTIDWKPDALSFLVDGKNVRTISASEALSDGISQYPNTPSRIQLSIWPAGISSSAPGTVQWAGGMIDWSDPDYRANGNFSATISSVSVQCADLQSPGSDITSYIYASNSSNSTPQISCSNKDTVLKKTDSSSSPSGSAAAPGSTSGISSGGGGGSAGSSSGVSSSSKSKRTGIIKIVAFAIGGLIALVFLALLARMIVRFFSPGAKPTKTAAGLGGGGGPHQYQPLSDPAPDAAVETHAMSQFNSQASGPQVHQTAPAVPRY